MQIQGYSSTQGINPFELNPQTRRQSIQEQTSSSGDTVTFSSEAMELLAKMQAAKQQAAQDEANKLETLAQAEKEEKAEKEAQTRADQSRSGAAGSQGLSANGAEDSGTAGDGQGDSSGKSGESDKSDKAAGGASGGGGSSNTDSTSEAEKLRQQIQQLSATVQNIMKGPLPTETKMTQSQPFEAQIQVLEQRLRELEAQAQQEKQQ